MSAHPTGTSISHFDPVIARRRGTTDADVIVVACLRRLAVLALAAALSATVAACDTESPTKPDTPDDNDVIGNGQLVQASRPVSGISGVNHAADGSLRIILGSTESLTIEAESNLLPYLETFVEGGILQTRVNTDVHLRETRPIRYVLTVTGLDSITLSGLGDVSMADLRTDQLALTMAGVGKIVVSGLAADTLTTSLLGVGSLVVSGRATNPDTQSERYRPRRPPGPAELRSRCDSQRRRVRNCAGQRQIAGKLQRRHPPLHRRPGPVRRSGQSRLRRQDPGVSCGSHVSTHHVAVDGGHLLIEVWPRALPGAAMASHEEE